MNLFRKSIYTLVALAAAPVLVGCDSFLEEYSQDLAKVQSWEDLDELLIGGAYMQPGTAGDQINGSGGDNINAVHFMSDEMVMFAYGQMFDASTMGENNFAFYTWQKDTGIDEKFSYRGGDERYFNDLYNKIAVCNQVLSQIDSQPVNSPGDVREIARVKGEAHFLRGFYYFLLANLYSEPYEPSTAASKMGVPLKLSAQIEDREFQRGTLAQTYAQILSDLQSAETELEGTTRTTVHQANQAAARLLLARVYLYMQDYVNAEAYAHKVIASDGALLDLNAFPTDDNFFGGSNPEILFAMGDYEIANAYLFDSYGAPAWSLSEDIAGLFVPGDLRSEKYIVSVETGWNPTVYNVFHKYGGPSGSSYTAGSIATFRSAEAYLIEAEACACLDREADARQALESLLAKRHSSEVKVTSAGAELISFIRDERAREFLLEGHRWFDLRRYSVNVKQPYTKEITHGYAYMGGWGVEYFDWYRLEPGDAAYTLALPRAILQFQPSLGTVVRPDRQAFKTTDSYE